MGSHPDATHCHKFGWKHVVEKSFGWPVFYILAEEQGRISGVLPLVWQKSFLFGNFLTSVPFLNAGGVLAEDLDTARKLIERAILIADECGAGSMEFRQRSAHSLPLQTRSRKLTVVRPSVTDAEQELSLMDKKLRADVKKSIKSGFEVDFGGVEYLDHFYELFAENMRDLGTPVYARQFFANIAEQFPEDIRICKVTLEGKAAAASFLIGMGSTIEAVWSASAREFRSLKPNMFMYWNILQFAGAKGFRDFDFGRSTPGSGTHKFKMQWNCQEVPLHWAYWTKLGEPLPELNPQNPKYKALIAVWQKLPVAITKVLGPMVVKNLP